ncbi:glycine zipper family protein [Paraburkholderia bannensis]|uniref:glycine zipper family protein n=1 Tax=Paraburkholderia bannensis TaxID=765414 RepID=UPI002AB625BB|nr:glycine zipper family protein [Paraburkholderia bannensis]
MNTRPSLLPFLRISLTLATVASICFAQSAPAQVIDSRPTIYPARGQTPYQQSNDDAACYGWAKGQTGFDPAWPATVPAPVVVPGGQRVVGAARGAAAGAVVGAIAGNAGKGAAAGAAIGTMAGGMERRQERRAIGAYDAQVEVNNEAGLSAYWRAWRACMAGRGYTVD